MGTCFFVGESGSGHAVVMDGLRIWDAQSLRPMEMLLLGTGGCAIYDVISILKKARQSVTACRVELHAQRGMCPRSLNQCNCTLLSAATT